MNAHISTEHTELTDLTELTYLRIPTDWTAGTKPSSTRPSHLLLTPPLSPLSLPSPPTTSVLPLSLHNNSFSSFSQFQISDFSCFKPTLSPSPSKLNQSVMETNPPDTGNVPTPPQFQASYIMPMPYPGAPGSPFFERANVTEFLERYENMCEDYRISLVEKSAAYPCIAKCLPPGMSSR